MIQHDTTLDLYQLKLNDPDTRTMSFILESTSLKLQKFTLEFQNTKLFFVLSK